MERQAVLWTETEGKYILSHKKFIILLKFNFTKSLFLKLIQTLNI